MSTTLVAHGVLRPNGWIQLLNPVDLPEGPCEVDVTLTVSKPTFADTEPPKQLPYEPSSGFYPDESISAPFDLPYFGPSRRVTARLVTGPYLPVDPIFPLAPGSVCEEEGASE